MPRPNVPLGIQANNPADYRNWKGGPDNEGIDLIGIIGRMLAGEDEQAFQPGGRSTFAPAGPVSTITSPDANIPTIQANPDPARVRPPGFVEDPRNVSTFPPSQEVPVDVNEPAPSVGTNRQQQQQESLQDYNPSLEMVTGMSGSQNNFPGVGAEDRSFLFEPAAKQKTLEEQLFEIIMRSGNV
jgi:hypothetical protein|tara:strand:+ start:1209 stop:1760 length:552 start_codon:yes stop_codon:yes gene_type:complete